jgi:hypothetical protein
MNFTFSLKFTGLCAFVPHEGDEENMRVILGNARDHAAGLHHMRHLAVLLVERRGLVSGYRDGSFPVDGKIGGYGSVDMIALPLEGEDLKIEPDTGALTLAPGPHPDDVCPNAKNATGFHWIARTADVGEGQISSRAFSGKHPHLVLARLKIRGGTLRTAAFSLTSNGERILKWQFRPTTGGGGPIGRPRALAEAMELSQQVSGNQVTLVSDLQGKDIVLKPIDGLVNAWMINMPKEDILGGPSKAPKPPDFHFVHFYRLSTRGASQHIPFPLPEEDDTCPIPKPPIVNLSNPRCPPALFTAT